MTPTSTDASPKVAVSNGAASPGVDLGDRRPIDFATDYLAAGLSVIPIRGDGSKAPALKTWKQYESELPTESDLQRGFPADNLGVAIIHGSVSGGTECIDVDNGAVFDPYVEEVRREAPGLVAKLTVVATPREGGGYHLIYRCSEIEGSQKLAFGADKKVLIETKGRGGYTLAPGCPGCCHPTGGQYEHISGPPLTELTTITPDERALLLRVARSFNEVVEDTATTTGKAPTDRGPGLSPGDDFNQRATWEEILTPHGWVQDHASGDRGYWRRPGKAVGWSATTGGVSTSGTELFCCFSDNASPFAGANGRSPCTSYSKFAAHATLNHAGDFSAAARALAALGYGEKRERVFDGGDRWVYPDSPDWKGDTPANVVTYRRITSAELAAGNFALEYLIDDVLVANQPALAGGPYKSLKTFILLALAIALDTGLDFLGRFKVNRRCKVCVMSGESGLATIQENCHLICASIGRMLCDLGIIWSPDLPVFGRPEHLKALEKFLLADGIEVLIIDPAYLSMGAGGDAGNIFAQGALLRSISELCQRLGVTLILAHHSKRNTGRDVYDVPELSDLAWSGFAEYARQWLLLNRRERYEPGTGEHKLWLSCGGSAGHSSIWAVDVNEGVRGSIDGRRWDVVVSNPSDARSDADKRKADIKAQQAAEQLDADRRAVCRLLAKHPTGLTKSYIRDHAPVGSRRVEGVIGAMVEGGELEPCDVFTGNQKCAKPGFKLAEPNG